jgi:hypothetical protein
VTATIALTQLSVRQLTVLVMAATRTSETLWPSPLGEGFAALFLATEPLDELVETEAFLKLHFVSRHDPFLVIQAIILYVYTVQRD